MLRVARDGNALHSLAVAKADRSCDVEAIPEPSPPLVRQLPRASSYQSHGTFADRLPLISDASGQGPNSAVCCVRLLRRCSTTVAPPDGPLIPDWKTDDQPREEGGATAGMNQATRFGAAILTSVLGRHVFKRDRVAGQHGPRLVRMRDRHLKPDPVYRVGVHPIEADEIGVLQSRRDAGSFQKAGRHQRFMKPEISTDSNKAFGYGALAIYLGRRAFRE